MCDGVGRYQVLESKCFLKHMFMHDGSCSSYVRPADVVKDALEDFQKECPSTTREVKHSHSFMVSKTF